MLNNTASVQMRKQYSVGNYEKCQNKPAVVILHHVNLREFVTSSVMCARPVTNVAIKGLPCLQRVTQYSPTTATNKHLLPSAGKIYICIYIYIYIYISVEYSARKTTATNYKQLNVMLRKKKQNANVNQKKNVTRNSQ